MCMEKILPPHIHWESLVCHVFVCILPICDRIH